VREVSEHVSKIRAILEKRDDEIASAKEARELLKLKGEDRVGFYHALSID
jgi:hypothetical protein